MPKMVPLRFAEWSFILAPIRWEVASLRIVKCAEKRFSPASVGARRRAYCQVAGAHVPELEFILSSAST